MSVDYIATAPWASEAFRHWNQGEVEKSLENMMRYHRLSFSSPVGVSLSRVELANSIPSTPIGSEPKPNSQSTYSFILDSSRINSIDSSELLGVSKLALNRDYSTLHNITISYYVAFGSETPWNWKDWPLEAILEDASILQPDSAFIPPKNYTFSTILPQVTHQIMNSAIPYGLNPNFYGENSIEASLAFLGFYQPLSWYNLIIIHVLRGQWTHATILSQFLIDMLFPLLVQYAHPLALKIGVLYLQLYLMKSYAFSHIPATFYSKLEKVFQQRLANTQDENSAIYHELFVWYHVFKAQMAIVLTRIKSTKREITTLTAAYSTWKQCMMPSVGTPTKSKGSTTSTFSPINSTITPSFTSPSKSSLPKSFEDGNAAYSAILHLKARLLDIRHCPEKAELELKDIIPISSNKLGHTLLLNNLGLLALHRKKYSIASLYFLRASQENIKRRALEDFQHGHQHKQTNTSNTSKGSHENLVESESESSRISLDSQQSNSNDGTSSSVQTEQSEIDKSNASIANSPSSKPKSRNLASRLSSFPSTPDYNLPISYNLGLQFLFLGNFEGAIQSFEQSIQILNPTNLPLSDWLCTNFGLHAEDQTTSLDSKTNQTRTEFSTCGPSAFMVYLRLTEAYILKYISHMKSQYSKPHLNQTSGNANDLEQISLESCHTPKPDLLRVLEKGGTIDLHNIRGFPLQLEDDSQINLENAISSVRKSLIILVYSERQKLNLNGSGVNSSAVGSNPSNQSLGSQETSSSNTQFTPSMALLSSPYIFSHIPSYVDEEVNLIFFCKSAFRRIHLYTLASWLYLEAQSFVQAREHALIGKHWVNQVESTMSNSHGGANLSSQFVNEKTQMDQNYFLLHMYLAEAELRLGHSDTANQVLSKLTSITLKSSSWPVFPSYHGMKQPLSQNIYSPASSHHSLAMPQKATVYYNLAAIQMSKSAWLQASKYMDLAFGLCSQTNSSQNSNFPKFSSIHTCLEIYSLIGQKKYSEAAFLLKERRMDEFDIKLTTSVDG